MRNGGKSIWFGDRSSFAVVKGEALGQNGRPAREALAHRICSDVFTFDQMACSSPQVMFVVGHHERDGVNVSSLLSAVADTAVAQGQTTETGHLIRKMVAAYRAAANGRRSSIEWRNAALTSVVSSRTERREYASAGVSSGSILWLRSKICRRWRGARPNLDALRLFLRGNFGDGESRGGFGSVSSSPYRFCARFRRDLGRLRHSF